MFIWCWLIAHELMKQSRGFVHGGALFVHCCCAVITKRDARKDCERASNLSAVSGE